MPGVGISLFLIAVGAILDFAVTASPDQHGFNVNTVGLILMIIGLVGLVISLAYWGRGRGSYGGGYRRRTVTDQSGNVVRQEDSYL